MSAGAAGSRRLTFTAERDVSVEELLRQNGCSKALITELKKAENGLLSGGERVRSTTVVKAGEALEINLPNRAVSRQKSDISVPIIYWDEDIILYDKPPGLACHRSGSHISDTLENAFEGVFRAVTRLDRDTSGLLLVARHQLAAGRLWQKTKKRYLAIARGGFEQAHGFIELPIMRQRPYEMLRIVDECGDIALTEYRVFAQNERAALVECILHTGRTHQARVHLAAAGHPILGDELYGGDGSLISRQALHCAAISFPHPITGEEMSFVAPLPEDMQKALEKAGLQCLTPYPLTQK